jgi:hypothetical protein
VNASTVFLIAAIGGAFAFSRDIVQLIIRRRKRLSEEEERGLRAPEEMHGIVISNTKAAMELQSAAMMEVRLTLEEERKERAAEQVRHLETKRRLSDVTAERDELIIRLARQSPEGRI